MVWLMPRGSRGWTIRWRWKVYKFILFRFYYSKHNIYFKFKSLYIFMWFLHLFCLLSRPSPAFSHWLHLRFCLFLPYFLMLKDFMCPRNVCMHIFCLIIRFGVHLFSGSYSGDCYHWVLWCFCSWLSAGDAAHGVSVCLRVLGNWKIWNC